MGIFFVVEQMYEKEKKRKKETKNDETVLYLFEINKWNAHGNGNDEVVRGDDRIDFSKHFGHQWWLGCHDDNLGTFDYLHIFMGCKAADCLK